MVARSCGILAVAAIVSIIHQVGFFGRRVLTWFVTGTGRSFANRMGDKSACMLAGGLLEQGFRVFQVGQPVANRKLARLYHGRASPRSPARTLQDGQSLSVHGPAPTLAALSPLLARLEWPRKNILLSRPWNHSSTNPSGSGLVVETETLLSKTPGNPAGARAIYLL